MMVSVYSLCYNEEFLIPFFLQHYGPVADRIIIYDNQSTDDSARLLRAAGAEIRPFLTGGEMRDDLMTALKNQCWKDDSADWIVLVDMDEFLYHADLRGALASTEFAVLQPPGYVMACRRRPRHGTPLTTQVREGFPESMSSKPCAFRRHAVSEMNFRHGQHAAFPNPTVKFGSPKGAMILHYHVLDEEHFVHKILSRKSRLSQANLDTGLSVHYLRTEEQIRADYATMLKWCCPIVPRHIHVPFS